MLPIGNTPEPIELSLPKENPKRLISDYVEKVVTESDKETVRNSKDLKTAKINANLVLLKLRGKIKMDREIRKAMREGDVPITIPKILQYEKGVNAYQWNLIVTKDAGGFIDARGQLQTLEVA